MLNVMNIFKHRFYLKACLIAVLLFVRTAHADIGFDVSNQKAKQLLITAEKFRLTSASKGFIPAQQALEIGQQQSDIRLQVYASLMLARLHEKKHNQSLARDLYEFSVQALLDNPDITNDPHILFYITEAARFQKKYDQGFLYIEKGIEIKKQESDAVYLSRSFDLHGNLYKGKKNYKKSLDSYFISLNYAEISRDQDLILNAYRSIAQASKKIDDFETSILFNEKALDIVEQKGNLAEIAQYLEYLSTDQRALGQYAQALQTAKRALSVQRELKNTHRISNLLLNISIIYLKLSSYDDALEYALEMLSIHEQAQDANGIASASNQVGNVYSRLKQYVDARYYYDRTLALDKNIVDAKYEAAAYRGIATVEQKLGNNESGLAFAEQAIEMYGKIKNSSGIASATRTIADIYRRMGENDKALRYFEKGLAISKDIGEVWGEASFSIHIAELLIDINSADEAREYIFNAKTIADKLNAKSLELDVYEALIRLETKEKNYQQALVHSETVFRLMKSLGADAVNDRVAELQIIQELEKKEREIEELKRTTKINELELGRQSTELELLNKEHTIASLRLERERFGRIFLISLTFLIGVALLLLYLRYRSFQQTQKILNAQSDEIHTKNQKLEELNVTKDRFFSIISHDLRGPVSSLVALANMLQENIHNYNPLQIKYYVDAICETSGKTYKLLDDLLTWATMQLRDADPLPRTCSAAESCDVAINHLEFSAQEKGITIENKIDKDVTIFVDKNMLSTVIRNLLVNAIKFTPKQGLITLFSETDSEFVTIHVKDTGVGISEQDQKNLFRIDKFISRIGTDGETGTGLGLTLCKDLIEKNGGELKLLSEPGSGSDFFFTFPQKLSDNSVS